MTDELDALLEDEEEEQTVLLPQSRRPAGWRARELAAGEEIQAAGAVMEKPARTAGKTGLSREGEGRVQAAVMPWGSGGAVVARPGGGRGRPTEKQGGLVLPEEGWERVDAVAGSAMYTQLARTRRAAEYRRERERVWLPLEKVGSPAGGTTLGDATALDKIFQRDARRYDGGFTWL